MPLSLNKIEEAAPELLSLAKQTQTAMADRNLSGLTAEVSIVLDFSYSMSDMYLKGMVQKLLERALSVATQLDDDGKIDLYLFHSTAEFVGSVDIANFRDYVNTATSSRSMGGTKYGNAIDEVLAHQKFPAAEKTSRGLFGKKKVTDSPLASPAALPSFVFFITDGETQDKDAAVASLVTASYRPVFFQFLSIGDHIPFLQKLDDLSDRYIDNADYKNVSSLTKLSDADLIGMILDEFPAWVEEERKRGQIV